MKISREKIIRFFDEKSPDKSHDGADVTSIISILGEDLLLGLLQHYWNFTENAESEIISYKCNRGSKQGTRLDAWLIKSVRGKKELYQVELKNWAVYAIGGSELKFEAIEKDLVTYSQKNWNKIFTPEKIPSEGVRKVLEQMKNPSGHEKFVAIPLVCFWFHITKSIKNPYSKRKYSNGKEVHIFSASAYLRILKDKYIDVSMPRVEKRIRLLSGLISGIKI